MEALLSSEQNPERQDVAIAESAGSGDTLEVVGGLLTGWDMQWPSWLGGQYLNSPS